MANTPPKHDQKNIMVLRIGSNPDCVELQSLDEVLDEIAGDFTIDFHNGEWCLKTRRRFEWIPFGSTRANSKIHPYGIIAMYDFSIPEQKKQALVDHDSKTWILNFYR